MEEITLRVKGSSKDPYEVIFIRDGDSLTALCDCPAGSFNNLCKHRVAILDGDSAAVVDEDVRKVATAVLWLAGTDVEAALQDLRLVEADKTASKSDLAAAKKRVAKAMSS